MRSVFAYRVSSGTCITRLVMCDNSEISPGSYKVSLRCPDSATSKLTTSKLAAGDMVVITEADTKVVILTTCRVVEMNGCQVSLLIDRCVSICVDIRAATGCNYIWRWKSVTLSCWLFKLCYV